jgi:MFS family permease
VARPSESRSSFRALFLPIYLPSLILSFCDGLLVPVLPLFANSLTPSFALVGAALAADAIGTLVADLPAGVMLRRLDRRGAMVLGVALVALATGLLVTVSGIWLLVAFRALAGIGAALWNISRHAHITEVTHGADRGRAVALFGGIRRAGAFAGPAVGGLIAGAYGSDGVFLLFAFLAALVLPLAWAFVDPQRSEGLAAAAPSLGPVLREQGRVLVVAGSGQLLAQAIRAGRRILIPLYGASVLGLSVEAIGIVLSVAALVDVALFYPAGMLMDRRGRKWAIVPSFVLQGLGMALIPFASGFVGLLLATSLIGLGNGLGSGTMMTLGADLAPRHALGEFLGVWRLIGDAGFTVGPLLVGGLASLVGLPGAAVATAAVGFAAAATFACGVPETLVDTKG